MLAAEEISRMSPAERLSVMESVWVSFARDGIDCPSPGWHGTVLDQRAARLDSGEASSLTVDELQTRLQDR